MKKGYIFILSVLILSLSAIMAYEFPEAWIARETQQEYEAYMNEMYEESLVVKAQFDDMVTYCKEHEEDLVKVSEMFLEQYHEDITSQETAEIAQNNTSSEWMELSEKLTLTDITRLGGKCVLYFCAEGGACLLYVVYINADDDEFYKFDIYGHLWGREEKINDNLYVCIFERQLI